MTQWNLTLTKKQFQQVWRRKKYEVDQAKLNYQRMREEMWLYAKYNCPHEYTSGRDYGGGYYTSCDICGREK